MKIVGRIFIYNLVLFTFFLLSCKKEAPTSPVEHMPHRPIMPIGPSVTYLDTSYKFSTVTTHPDDDNVCYQFDWGDGETSSWTDYFATGDTVSASHTFSNIGRYYVKAQAKDPAGNITQWSESLIVKVNHKFGTLPIST